MPTFPKLQRNISNQNYLIDILLSFIIVLFNSTFIYFPLFIGLVITLDLNLVFVLSFLFFTEITHNFPYLSLILFYFIYKNYIYFILSIKIDKNYINILSIFLVYFLYFLSLSAYYTINEIDFEFNPIYLFYYGLIEALFLFLKEFK